jgi:hypothetical protein
MLVAAMPTAHAQPPERRSTREKRKPDAFTPEDARSPSSRD